MKLFRTIDIIEYCQSYFGVGMQSYIIRKKITSLFYGATLQKSVLQNMQISILKPSLRVVVM